MLVSSMLVVMCHIVDGCWNSSLSKGHIKALMMVLHLIASLSIPLAYLSQISPSLSPISYLSLPVQSNVPVDLQEVDKSTAVISYTAPEPEVSVCMDNLHCVTLYDHNNVATHMAV